MKRYADFYAEGAFLPCTNGESLPVTNPSTERVIGEVVLSSMEDVGRAIASARSGADGWATSTLDQRRQVLLKLRSEMETRLDKFAVSLAEEMGCPVWLGKLMQVPMPLKGLDYAFEGLDHIQWREQIRNGLVERVPAGVIAAITPWNFPLHQIVAKIAACIAAGCAVVLKPSEVAPGAAQLLMEAVHSCGLPPGVVNMVWGDAKVGHLLVSDLRVDRISFTGSTAVGRRIMQTAAESLKPLTLELGGKSAAVLLEDVDLDAAVSSVTRLALANSGQACVSQSRLIAPKRLVPEIIERFISAVEAWPIGDPRLETTRLGPVATQSQFLHVNGMIERAIHEGATLCTGGSGRPEGFERGWFVQPSLFVDVAPHMELAQREVFGPVLALMSYETEDEAASLANSTPYGLSGAVWSKDGPRATRFAQRMKTGQVVINGAAQNLATPFGGWGQSGFGRENGRYGIEDLLNYRSLHGAYSSDS